MFDERVEGGSEIFRLVLEDLTAGFIRQVLDVHRRRPAELSHARRPNHDAVFQPLITALRNYSADDTSRFIDSLRRCLPEGAFGQSKLRVTPVIAIITRRPTGLPALVI